MLGDRWGVSDAETRRRYPCDDFVPAPTLRAWRGVSVDASPSAVWRWVAQIRLAPYSYAWIDNLGRRSPQRLVDLPEPVAGEAFTTAGGRRRGRILAVEPGRHLTAEIMGVGLTALYMRYSVRARRPLLAGLFFSMATLTRTPLVFAGKPCTFPPDISLAMMMSR